MIEFRVMGLPAPQGSKKAVGLRRSKKSGRMVTVMAESSKKVKPWRKLVEAEAALVALRTGTLAGPLRVDMVFTLPRPKTIPKARMGYPTTYPDVSKLARSTEDALTTSGLIGDDGQITDLHVLKRYVGAAHVDALQVPGVVIRVFQLEAE